MQRTQFAKGISWRSFVKRITKETFVLLNDEVTEAWHFLLVLLFITAVYLFLECFFISGVE